MEKSELLELLSPEGMRLLNTVPDYRSEELVKQVSRLRAEGHSPALVAAVLSQARLRSRAAAKFGPFAESMLFTQAGLEQASRLAVAARHAERFRAAGLERVADLGCGIGADSLALAALGLTVHAVEIDEITATLAAYNLAPFDTVTVHHLAAEEFELRSDGPSGIDAVWLDPARRSGGHSDTRRISDPEQYTPSLDFALGLAEQWPAGIKLGPGFDRDRIPEDAEAQWVSHEGEVVELGLWFGPLARTGIRRSALVLTADGGAELSAEADAPDVGVGPLGEYLYEPDGSVIRARLIGKLAEQLDAAMLSEGIAYFSAAEAVRTPFASCFRVLETMPLDARGIAKRLRALGIGTLEVKKRGVDLDPAAFRRSLGLRGDAAATLIATRIDGRHRAVLAERLG